MSFTLATLKSTVQDYCETTETTFVSELDTFIKEAEERILKNVSLPVFRKNVEGIGTSGNPYLSTPSDFLASYSLALIISDEYTYPLLKHVSGDSYVFQSQRFSGPWVAPCQCGIRW